MFKLGDTVSRRLSSQVLSTSELDEDSFGPFSLQYDVNMTPTPSKQSPSKQDSPGGSKKKPRTRSTSRGPEQ